MMRSGFTPRFILLCVINALFSFSVFAHAPLLSCDIDAKPQILQCEGGFSDGSSAQGIEIRVLSYEDKLLDKGILDKDSTIKFPLPQGEYYVVFNGGPGHIIEVDYHDIPQG